MTGASRMVAIGMARIPAWIWLGFQPNSAESGAMKVWLA
jgi:hypothetical protein